MMTAERTTHADELLEHISRCPQCKRAQGKSGRRGAHCDVAKELIRLTLKERHGS